MRTGAKCSTSKEATVLTKEIVKLRKTKYRYAITLKKALKLSENAIFQNSLKKLLRPLFTTLQFREITKEKMDRTFTNEEIIMALNVYKVGPRAYRWLRKVFVLPSPVMLSRMVSRVSLKPGINDKLFNQLKKKVNKMKPDDKLCTLLFDEMSLSPHLDYNRKKDKITGFVNNGTEVKRDIADCVLVFMIRGIAKNYKQPIAYSFCSGSTKQIDLKNQIEHIIIKLHSIGLRVLATICDQATTNFGAINHLVENTKEKYLKEQKEWREAIFEIEGKKVVPLYDVPHLLKGIRNNLITKDLIYEMNGEKRTAKWKHITQLYEKNPEFMGIKIIKNFTENHCNPEKIPKMEVKYASQLFSQTVGKTMGYLAEKCILPEECKDTADVLLFFDQLFDSMNGSFKHSSNRTGKHLLRNLTPNSKHNMFWKNSKKILASMKFLSRNGNSGAVPSITYWLRTVENMEVLRDILFKEYNIKSISCRHFNQVPLETFFGSVRSHGIRNVSPTCAAFESAFVSLLVNNMSSSYSPSCNCENDTCSVFVSFNDLFFGNDPLIDINVNAIDAEDLNDNIIVDFDKKLQDVRITAQLQYVTGYILRKAKKIYKSCKACRNDLYDKENKNDYLRVREYNNNKMYLTYPHQNLVNCLSNMQDIINHILKRKTHTINIKHYLKSIFYVKVDVDFVKCKIHKKELVEFIFDITCRFFLCNWCRDVNKIFNGTRKEFDNNDDIQNLAFTYNTKRKRKDK